MEGLLGLLSEDVTLWSDGGGKTRAALHPIYGADKVASFLSGILRKAPPGFIVRQTQINGQASLVAYLAYAVPHFILDVSTGHAFPLSRGQGRYNRSCKERHPASSSRRQVGYYVLLRSGTGQAELRAEQGSFLWQAHCEDSGH